MAPRNKGPNGKETKETKQPTAAKMLAPADESKRPGPLTDRQSRLIASIASGIKIQPTEADSPEVKKLLHSIARVKAMLKDVPESQWHARLQNLTPDEHENVQDMTRDYFNVLYNREWDHTYDQIASSKQPWFLVDEGCLKPYDGKKPVPDGSVSMADSPAVRKFFGDPEQKESLGCSSDVERAIGRVFAQEQKNQDGEPSETVLDRIEGKGALFAKTVGEYLLGDVQFPPRESSFQLKDEGSLGCSSDFEMAVGRVFSAASNPGLGKQVRRTVSADDLIKRRERESTQDRSDGYLERYNVRRMLDGDDHLNDEDRDIIVKRVASQLFDANQSQVRDIVAEEVERYIREKGKQQK